MHRFKNFRRAVKQDLNRISILIKGMEFRLARLRGLLRKRMREEINEMKRLKESIFQRLEGIVSGRDPDQSLMQSIRNDIALLQERCRHLKAQHL